MAVDLWMAIATMSFVAIAAGLFAGGCAYSLRGQRTIVCLAMAVLAMVLFMVHGSAHELPNWKGRPGLWPGHEP